MFGVADELGAQCLAAAEASLEVERLLRCRRHCLQFHVVHVEPEVIRRELQLALTWTSLQWKVLQVECTLLTEHVATVTNTQSRQVRLRQCCLSHPLFPIPWPPSPQPLVFTSPPVPARHVFLLPMPPNPSVSWSTDEIRYNTVAA